MYSISDSFSFCVVDYYYSFSLLFFYYKSMIIIILIYALINNCIWFLIIFSFIFASHSVFNHLDALHVNQLTFCLPVAVSFVPQHSNNSLLCSDSVNGYSCYMSHILVLLSWYQCIACVISCISCIYSNMIYRIPKTTNCWDFQS